MPIYASPEQFMRDRSDYARKGIGRGRSVVAVIFSGGVLFVAENPSPTLHKVSEIYDRIGFAATGRYNEYENLRTAGIRLADVRGYSYDRGDVTGRWLANAYAQTLGSVFSEHPKPLEVELCVAEVGPPDGPTDGSADQLYRISYDGSMFDEPKYVVMGGVTEPVAAALEATFADGWDLPTALRSCVSALGTAADGTRRDLTPELLEVAVLDRRLLGRTFRRIDDLAVAAVLAETAEPGPAGEPAEPAEPAQSAESVEPAESTETAEPAALDENGAGDPAGDQE